MATVWSLKEEELERLAARLQAIKPKLSVEFGSGLSTKVLRQHSEWTLSLEHKQFWQRFSEQGARGLPGEVRLCSIGSVATPAGDRPCYQTKLPNEIDFLLIDGPPGSIGRAGTLFHAWPHLKQGAVIWLDDWSRPGEQEALRLWRDSFEFEEEALSPQVIEFRKR